MRGHDTDYTHIGPATTPHLGEFNEDLRLLGIDALRAASRVRIAARDVAHFMELAA